MAGSVQALTMLKPFLSNQKVGRYVICFHAVRLIFIHEPRTSTLVKQDVHLTNTYYHHHNHHHHTIGLLQNTVSIQCPASLPPKSTRLAA